jgi:cytochrome P450
VQILKLKYISTFVFAGSETTSNALCRTLYELARHEDVQNKLREELDGVNATAGQLDYDRINDLKYLDAICRETLRL